MQKSFNLYTRVPAEMLETLERLARAEDRKISSVIRVLIREALDARGLRSDDQQA